MRGRRKWLWVVPLAVILMLVAGALLWLTAPTGPRKPSVITRGDYSYAIGLADYRLERLMAQRHVPGAAIVLIDDQQIVWQANVGLADIEREIPVDSDTVFKLWSLAKPFTALEIVRLVEEGRLDLDAPLATYLPAFTIQSRFPATEPITLRHLLAHRSGLPRNACRYGFGWEVGPDAAEQVANALGRCFLAYPTGSRYKYSNVGYDVLGYIVQELTGSPYPAHMRDALLEPIGMSRSAFYASDLPTGSDLALGYEHDRGRYYPYEQRDIGAVPSGNLYATADDLAAFVRFLFRGGEVAGSQLIRPESLATMFEDSYRRPADPQPMGLGWKLGRVAGSELLAWHDGGPSEGIGSLIAMLPERKLAVVLLGNATTLEGSITMPIAIDILEAMLEARDGLVVAGQAPEETLTLPASVLEGYVGDYAVLGDVMEVTRTGSGLKGRIQGMAFDLVAVTPARFRVRHWLLGLGLDRWLALPMDLRELAVEFQVADPPAFGDMIIDFGGFYFEYGPRYPTLSGERFERGLVGAYDRHARLASGAPAPDRLGGSSIALEDGRLVMSGVVGPILPLDQDTIVILSGPFQGETIGRNPDTGDLYHQGVVFRPVARSAGDGD